MFLLWASLAMVLNVLDSVTTAIALRQYPTPNLEGEGNPIMRWLMCKNKALAEIVKQGAVLAILVWLWRSVDFSSIVFVAITLSLVVLNNSYVVVSRVIKKRKTMTPAEVLQQSFRIPDRLLYIVMVGVIFSISVLITNAIV